MDLIKRPKQVQRTEKAYLSNEKYQDYAESQFKNIYDKADEIVKTIEEGGIGGGTVGPQGPQGPQGPRGNYWRPTVDEEGNISWKDSSSTTPPPTTNIQGPQGPEGKQGPQGEAGEQGPQGQQGEKGEDGLGVPLGGTTGQVLAKKSDEDNDTEWIDNVGGDGSGSGIMTGAIIGWEGDSIPEGYEEVTGGNIEKIQNENGVALKFSDGTMICTLNITVTDQAINTVYTNGIYLGTRFWDFPVVFTELYCVSCTKFLWGTSGSWSSTGSNTLERAVLRGFDTVSRATGTTTQISAFAIGRWK